MARERVASRQEAGEHVEKARTYVQAAQRLLADSLFDPAASCAVTAGIHASDAICILSLGRHSTAPDHREALKLLGAAGSKGERAASTLTRLLSVKDKSQYGSGSTSQREATESVKQAQALLELARDALAE